MIKIKSIKTETIFKLSSQKSNSHSNGNEVLVALYIPTDCSPPGSSVHGILLARVLEGLPFPTPGNLPDPRIEPASPAL